MNSPPVVLETVDEETIIVNLDTGSYYDLNAVGGHVLHALEAGTDLEAAVDLVAARYAVERERVAAEVHPLVDELLAEGILSATDGPATEAVARATGSSSNGAEASSPSRRYESPVLAKFTDMQELLLLDPVHEVDDAGWPNKA